ncbi:hypothetical protein BGX38DRAFT_752240 [Terfezia claveryi]|nr:hypothetical protein BGX38DRAFT_752240 [Terfezia claveryi]
MRDERYCKKKLEQFRKEYAQPGTDGESPAGAKLGRSSFQPSGSQPGSSGGTEDSPMVNGVNDVKVRADEGSAQSTPASSLSPRKRNREDEDGGAGGDNQEMDQSPRKRSKSSSPAYVESPPGSTASQRMETSVQPDSLPQSPGVAEVLQLSLPVMGTPIKREREEDNGDGDIEMKDGSEERVIKKVRSRSNSASRGFENEMKRQPAVVHTGA